MIDENSSNLSHGSPIKATFYKNRLISRARMALHYASYLRAVVIRNSWSATRVQGYPWLRSPEGDNLSARRPKSKVQTPKVLLGL